MMTLELDDETATLLNQLVEQEHISPAQLVKIVLLEHLEDCQDAKKKPMTLISVTLTAAKYLTT